MPVHKPGRFRGLDDKTLLRNFLICSRVICMRMFIKHFHANIQTYIHFHPVELLHGRMPYYATKWININSTS